MTVTKDIEKIQDLCNQIEANVSVIRRTVLPGSVENTMCETAKKNLDRIKVLLADASTAVATAQAALK